MGECSDARKEEIRKFASKAFNKKKVEEYVNTAKCLIQSSLYIQGEPDSRNEASVSLKYGYLDHEFWPEHWQKSYAQCKAFLEQQHEKCEEWRIADTVEDEGSYPEWQWQWDDEFGGRML